MRWNLVVSYRCVTNFTHLAAYETMPVYYLTVLRSLSCSSEPSAQGPTLHMLAGSIFNSFRWLARFGSFSSPASHPHFLPTFIGPRNIATRYISVSSVNILMPNHLAQNLPCPSVLSDFLFRCWPKDTFCFQRVLLIGPGHLG